MTDVYTSQKHKNIEDVMDKFNKQMVTAGALIVHKKVFNKSKYPNIKLSYYDMIRTVLN